jgi:hypothetical protein
VTRRRHLGSNVEGGSSKAMLCRVQFSVRHVPLCVSGVLGTGEVIRGRCLSFESRLVTGSTPPCTTSFSCSTLSTLGVTLRVCVHKSGGTS